MEVQSRSDLSSHSEQPEAQTQIPIQSTALTLKKFPFWPLLTLRFLGVFDGDALTARDRTVSLTHGAGRGHPPARQGLCLSLVRSHTRQAGDPLFMVPYIETSNDYPEEFTES